MSDPLGVALNSYRFWRDIGADVLIVALLVEFLIEAWWPEQPHRKHFKLSRKKAMTLAAFVVFAGVVVERIWGTLADDKSDEIRIGLQERMLSLSPRFVRLFPVADSISSELKAFKGQRFVIVVGDRSELLLVPDDSQYLAVQLSQLLDASGWLGPTGQAPWVADPKQPSQRLLTAGAIQFVSKCPASEMFFEIEKSASEPTRHAMRQLSQLLSERARIQVGYAEGRIFPVPTGLLTDKDLIVIFVGNRTT